MRKFVIPTKFANGVNGQVSRMRLLLRRLRRLAKGFYEAKGRGPSQIGGLAFRFNDKIHIVTFIYMIKKKPIMVIKLIDWKINYYNGLFILRQLTFIMVINRSCRGV